METTNRAVPTGCYKCGRPGHWSRDCPLDPSPNSNPNPNPIPNSAAAAKASYFSKVAPSGGPAKGNFGAKPEKPKKLPKTRPKLTPELLLSDDGLGYVLRYFPSHFKYRGRGNEVRDLGHLLGMYKEWNNHLIPYYSFDQFVQKVEKVAATKQVKRCIQELRERVANGGDPSKLHEPPTENHLPVNAQETMKMDENEKKDAFTKKDEEEIFNEMFVEQATHENDDIPNVHKTTSVRDGPSCSASEETRRMISEEQKARMEANRLKALAKAAASRARANK